jgi:hypothetical protein
VATARRHTVLTLQPLPPKFETQIPELVRLLKLKIPGEKNGGHQKMEIWKPFRKAGRESNHLVFDFSWFPGFLITSLSMAIPCANDWRRPLPTAKFPLHPGAKSSRLPRRQPML